MMLKGSVILLFLLLHCSFLSQAATSKHLITIEEENWRMLLNGEWMVEFYAPWCPACKDLQKSWNAFADWSKDLDIRVAEVDVTSNPGLSGRFLVTALPTIYHVKNGVFRTYIGSKDREEFISFVESKKWTVVDPVPQWKHPDSTLMAVMAMFFKLSMSVRDLHHHLVETRGVPAWASYTLFGGVTLLLGCLLGFLIVCAIDMFFPTGPTVTTDKKKKGRNSSNSSNNSNNNNTSKGGAKKGDKKEDRVNDNEEEARDPGASADESTVRQRKTDGKRRK